MGRRTVSFVAVGIAAVAVAALAVALIVASGDESSADPNETAVTELCRDAAADEPGMVEGVEDFDVSELTHEAEDGITFYRATGTVSTSDGYGGTNILTFDCKTKLVADGTRWEMIDIFVM